MSQETVHTTHDNAALSHLVNSVATFQTFTKELVEKIVIKPVPPTDLTEEDELRRSDLSAIGSIAKTIETLLVVEMPERCSSSLTSLAAAVGRKAPLDPQLETDITAIKKDFTDMCRKCYAPLVAALVIPPNIVHACEKDSLMVWEKKVGDIHEKEKAISRIVNVNYVATEANRAYQIYKKEIEKRQKKPEVVEKFVVNF